MKKTIVREIFLAGLSGVEPYSLVKRKVRLEGDILKVEQLELDLSQFGSIYLVGAGKAFAAQAKAIEEILGQKIKAGIGVTKYGHTLPLERIKLFEAGHPLPDKEGGQATEAILGLLSEAKEEDLILCLLSGGGSALLFAPVRGISLEEIAQLNAALLSCGAKIDEINAVRKHLSSVKGGQLAKRAYPARLVSLILSDVIGDPLDVIASGPTTGDESTFADALKVLKRYDLEDKVPTAILSHLQRGEPETPKKEDKIFERVTNIIIGNNRQALYAARDKAGELGFTPLILTSEMEGEAKEAAKVFASICKEIRSSSNPMSPPACILAGGETTVTLKGDGRGGRNQEFALAAAMQIKGFEEITILAAGTDGTDGPTEAAGAVVDGKTLSKIDKDPEEYLKNNDSYHFFKDSPCHLITGPTRTNVMDMVIGLVG